MCADSGVLDQSFGGPVTTEPPAEPQEVALEYGLTNEPGVACGVLTLPTSSSCTSMSLSFSPVRPAPFLYWVQQSECLVHAHELLVLLQKPLLLPSAPPACRVMWPNRPALRTTG